MCDFHITVLTGKLSIVEGSSVCLVALEEAARSR